MYWGDKAFHTLNYELKHIFKEKIVKLSIDGGFTCPNRDGSVGTRGCIFCSESGSGDFTSGCHVSIPKQIEMQKQLLSEKWAQCKYIAYFQSFTSTYDTVPKLQEKYESALACEGVVGLAIATRPDAITPEIVEYLKTLNQKTFLWVELGLQTIHENSAAFIRRGYPLAVFDKAFALLQAAGIKTVVHLIANLPGESSADFYKSIEYMAKIKPWGLKIHMLHILKSTDLENYYQLHPFEFMDADAYIELIGTAIEMLPPEIVIHRITGDGKKEDLIAPRWPLNKRYVLNGVDKYFRSHHSYQGIRSL